MLLTNRYKFLLASCAVGAVMLLASVSVQATNCGGAGEAACAVSENSVSWEFRSEPAASLSAAKPAAVSARVHSSAMPLILASAEQPASTDEATETAPEEISEEPSAEPSAAGLAPVSIEQSLSAGLSLSNTLAASRQAFVVARQAIGAATASNDLTGNLSLSGSDIRTDSKTVSGGFVRDESRVGSITLNKRVYDSGEADTRLRVAELDLNSARATYQLAEQNVMFDIISAHLNVLTAQKAFAIRDANERRLQAHTEAARIRLDAGTSTPTRLAEAEARLARAQSDKILAEAALQTALEAYQSLTGIEASSLRGFDSPAVLPQTMAEAEEQANTAHPSVVAAVLGEKSSGLQFKILKQSVLPKVDFSVTASQTDRKGISMDKSEVTTQLSLSTPFLVTEGTRSAARSRLASHARAQLDAAESRRVVRLAARRAFRDYQASVAQLQAVETELVAARLVAEGTATEVEFGLKTFLDQLDAEQDMSDVELRRVQAQQAFVLNGYEVLRATGQLAVSLFALSEVPPALDLISDPSSRYPYILPIAVE